MPTPFLRPLFIAASLLPALPLGAAEAFYIIDNGLIYSVDTNTGATLNTFNDGAQAGGLAFTNHDTLWRLADYAGGGSKVFRYAPDAAPHTWKRTNVAYSGFAIRIGTGLALRNNGLLFATSQNTHDLWSVQDMYSPDFALGRVRSYSPYLFPYHIAASPLDGLYATFFYNGNLQVTRNGTDLTTPGFTDAGGICFDYTGYPYTNPGTQVTTTHSLLYVSSGNGNTVRRYDAETMQPYGKPTDRSNPVLVSAGTGGMIGIDRIAVDPETGTLFAMGRNANYKDGFNYPDIVMAGFSTEDGTPRGLGGSNTDPVVYHRPWGNGIRGFCIRPGVQVQPYNGGTHILGSMTFADPGKLLALTSTAPSTVTIQPGASLPAISLSSTDSEGMKAIGSVGSSSSIISAAMNNGGSLKIPATSTMNITTGATATDGGTLEVEAGGTLNCPSGDVTIGVSSRFRAAGLIAAKSLRAQSGGVIAPGSSPGTLTLQGSLDLLAGSVLEIEIAGTQAGVTHDVVNVQNALVASLNGSLVPQLTGGFTPQPSDTFTVLTSSVALSGTIQNLSAGRVSTAGGRGSFALTIISGGKGIQLSDYQSVPALQAWRNLFFTPAQQADPAVSGHEGDPDGDGLKNLVEFALNANPLSGAAPASLPRGSTAVNGPPAFTFTRLAGGITSPAGYDVEGIRYVVEHSNSLSGWTALHPTDPEVASWSVTPTGDNITETVRVELAPAAGPRQLMDLRVSVP